MATPMTWLKFGRQLLYSQFMEIIPTPTGDFSGQTILVTGSNTGLGLEACRYLMRLKASKVILAVRDIAKGEAAAKDLHQSTGATRTAIEVWPLDLSNLDTIKSLADRATQLERLDAAILNAGIMMQRWEVVNGLEAHIAVNVVYTVLLGLLLLPKLRVSAKTHKVTARLAFVTSDAHYVAQVREAAKPGSLFDALNDEGIALMQDRYSTSKLFLLYAVREIAAQSSVTPESNVLITALTPGMCHSSLFRDPKPWLHAMIERIVLSILARSTATGGAVLVDAIKPDQCADVHGAFLMDCKIAHNGPNVDSMEGQALQKRFNEELFEKLEAIHAGIMQTLI